MKKFTVFSPFSLVKIKAQYIASVENVKTELGLFIDSVALRAGQTRWEKRNMVLKNAGDSSLVFQIILAY